MLKFGKKKIIILIIIVVFVILIGTGTAVFFLVIKDKNKAPDLYFGKDEEISSITKIVGDRTLEEPKSKKKKSKTSETYNYIKVKDAAGDIEKYVKYLQDKKKFQDVEMPKEDKEDKEATEPETETPENDSTPKTHYELGADSKQKGTMLKIIIDYKKDSYKVVLKTSSETVEEVVKKIEDEKAKKLAEEDPYTRMDAESAIRSLSAAELGLPAEPSSYLIISMEGRVQYERKDYYDIRVYQKIADGANQIMGRYMIDCSSVNRVLKYDINNDSYTAISKQS